MWISKAHMQLIRESSAELRAFHEQAIRDRDAIIHSQETRLLSLQQERNDLFALVVNWRKQDEERINRVPEMIDSSWEPQDWQSILAKQTKEEMDKEAN